MHGLLVLADRGGEHPAGDASQSVGKAVEDPRDTVREMAEELWGSE